MTMEIVSVADLKIGMFVAEPDCPWTEFNFAFQGFVISTPDQVDMPFRLHRPYTFVK